MVQIVVIALIVFLVFGIVAAVIMNAQAERRRRVMTVVRGAAASDATSNKISAQDQRRSDFAKKLKSAEDEPDEEKKKKSISSLLLQAGIDASPKAFWIGSAVFAIVATILVKLIGMSPFVTLMAAIISFFGIPRLFLKIKAKSRQKKFMDEFADALDSMTRLLKAGMPVTEAISMAAREFTGPVGDIMGYVFDQQKIGIPLPEAVLKGAERMPLTEMQMFATAVSIQAQTGSSLSEVLENLSAVLRARFRLKRKVQALSSEAKASAGIIGALPVLVATGMYFINREYIEVLFIDPTGKFLLGTAIAWMCVGILVMRQMINFKV